MARRARSAWHTGEEVVGSIGARLLNASVACCLDGHPRPWHAARDAEPLRPHRDGPESLGVLRIGRAHLATAVRRLRRSKDRRTAMTTAFYDFEALSPSARGHRAFRRDEKVVARSIVCARGDRCDEANRRFADDPLKLERIADCERREVIRPTPTVRSSTSAWAARPDTSYLKHSRC